MQDDANNNRRRVGKRPSYESQKISKALAEECSTAGIALETFLLLRPSERMKKLGMQDSEIPDERRYRDYWRRLKSEREDMADASEDSCRE
jgi:hypothetical protein